MVPELKSIVEADEPEPRQPAPPKAERIPQNPPLPIDPQKQPNNYGTSLNQNVPIRFFPPNKENNLTIDQIIQAKREKRVRCSNNSRHTSTYFLT